MFSRNKPLILVVSAITLILLGICSVYDTWPRFSGDVKSLFPTSSITKGNLEDAREYFGSVQVDVVLVDGNAAGELSFFVDELLALDGILRVTAPVSETDDFPLPLLSNDRQFARILLEIESGLPDEERITLDSELQALLEQYSEFSPIRTGQFTLTESVTRKVTTETLQKVPIAGGILFILLSYLFRSVVFAATLLLAPLLALTWAMLLSAILGSSFGPISQLLPSFLLAVGTSYSVHVAARVLEATSEQINAVTKEVIEAIALAAFTTIVGLLSLLLLGVTGVTEFALPAAFGVLLCYCFALLFSRNAALAVRSSRGALQDVRQLYRLDPWRAVKLRIVVPLIVLAILAIPGILRINFSIELNSFLPNDSIERQQLTTIESAFPGNHFLDLVLTKTNSTGSENDFKSRTLEIRDIVTKLPEVVTVVSAFDFKTVNPSKVSSFLSKDGGKARLLIETGLQGRELLALKERILGALKGFEKQNGVELAISSVELLLAEQAESLLSGVLQSLAVTLGVLVVLLLVLFKNPLVVCVGIIPNIVPIVTVFGLGGHLLSQVNIGTAVAGAIALAIAADDTFHLLCCWKKYFSEGCEARSAAKKALQTAFGAMLTTSIVLTSVFLVLATSKVEPVQHYGMFIAGMLFLGLCSDVVLVSFFLGKLNVKVRQR